jgi:hypothetical protein
MVFSFCTSNLVVKIKEIIGHNSNPYEQAIIEVGNILEQYDSDKRYPVFGFGKCLSL